MLGSPAPGAVLQLASHEWDTSGALLDLLAMLFCVQPRTPLCRARKQLRAAVATRGARCQVRGQRLRPRARPASCRRRRCPAYGPGPGPKLSASQPGRAPGAAVTPRPPRSGSSRRGKAAPVVRLRRGAARSGRMESAGACCASGGSRGAAVVCEKLLFKGKLPEPLFQLACGHQRCAYPVHRNVLCVWNTATAQVKLE